MREVGHANGQLLSQAQEAAQLCERRRTLHVSDGCKLRLVGLHTVTADNVAGEPNVGSNLDFLFADLHVLFLASLQNCPHFVIEFLLCCCAHQNVVHDLVDALDSFDDFV